MLYVYLDIGQPYSLSRNERKRSRWDQLSDYQRTVLQQTFEKKPSLTRNEKRELAKSLNLDEKDISYWYSQCFVTKRTKYK